MDATATNGGADMTADDNRAAVTAADLTDHVVWRTAANRSALQHNKFLVLTNNDQPVAVWTGSTNLTQGAIFGHLNVGHLIHDLRGWVSFPMAHPFVELRWESIEFRQVKQGLVRRVGGELRAVTGRRPLPWRGVRANLSTAAKN